MDAQQPETALARVLERPWVTLALEDGGERALEGHGAETRTVRGREVTRWVVTLPVDLPPGDH